MRGPQGFEDVACPSSSASQHSWPLAGEVTASALPGPCRAVRDTHLGPKEEAVWPWVAGRSHRLG